MSNLFNKLAFFTDIHYGMRNNARQHNEDCDAFIDWFIQEAKAKGCETCIFGGDWHHNRASLNISTMKWSIQGLRKLSEAFDKVYMILGNHDLFYRESRDINSIEFVEELENVYLIRDTHVEGDVALVSWLVGDEWKKVPKIKSKYMFGRCRWPARWAGGRPARGRRSASRCRTGSRRHR